MRQEQTAWNERRIFIDDVGEWTSSWITRPRSIQAASRRRNGRTATPWVGTGRVFTPNAGHENIAVGARGPNRGPAITRHVPGKSDTWREMPPLIVDSRLADETRITGKIEARGCVLEYRAVDAVDESCVVEVVDSTRGARNDIR